MSGIIDYKNKNRFTRQIEITSGGNESLYFTLSASDGSDFEIVNDDLAIKFLNDGDIRDVRLDVQFLMPDDDYMIYVGTA